MKWGEREKPGEKTPKTGRGGGQRGPTTATKKGGGRPKERGEGPPPQNALSPFVNASEKKIFVVLSAAVKRFGVSRIQDFNIQT